MNYFQKQRFLSEIYPSPLDILLLKEMCEKVKEKAVYEWFPATSGNFSIKSTKDDVFYVSPSGVEKSRLSWTSFVPMNIKGNTLGALPAKPSLEALIHLGIYEHLPETKVIFHAHSPFLSKALAGKKTDLHFHSNELLKLFGEDIYTKESLLIKVAPNPHPKDLPAFMPQMNDYIAKEIGCVLFADHGIYAFAREVSRAVAIIEVLERLCSI